MFTTTSTHQIDFPNHTFGPVSKPSHPDLRRTLPSFGCVVTCEMHSSSTVALREELRTRSKTLRVQQNSWGASRTWKTTRSIWVDPVIHRDESRVLLHDLRREMYPFLLQAKAQVFEEYHFYPLNSSKEPKRHPVYFSHRLVLCSSELHMRESVWYFSNIREHCDVP